MTRRAGAVGGMACAALAAGALTGCGSSGASRPMGGAPVTRTTRVADRVPAAHVSAAIRAQEAALHRTVSAALHAGARSRARYGGIPRDLRGHQAAPRDQVVPSTAAHPAEPITGVTIALREASGSARAVAVGPYVPLKDQGSFRNHVSATWRVTFSQVQGRVALRPSMFSLSDEQGHTLRPRVSVLSGGRLPAHAPAGRSLTVVLEARTSIGSGTLYFTPRGSHFLAAWQFDAETD